MNNTKLSTIFAKNRAEELPDDIWNKYVLPLNYEDSNLLSFSKSTVVKGGRGSGKTMFLKYHCYPTIFSKNKSELLESELSDIGIYWRPDTDFSNMIIENYLGDKWKVAFNAYIGLSIFSEFSKLITSFIASNYKNKNHINLAKELIIPDDFKELFKLDDRIKVTDFDTVCQKYRSQLNDWLNYPEGKPPIIFGAKEKLLYFINTVLSVIDPFKDTIFHIFIDEFENLAKEQQILINSWIKHSQSPIIFHIAYKKHYKVTSDTLSDEQIVDVNDYRIIDLEKLYEDNFEILASEIILSKLNSYFDNKQQIYNLSDIKSIRDRRDSKYQNKTKTIVKNIFPSLSISETVVKLFEDNALYKKLEKLIQDGIKFQNSSLDYSLFIDLDRKEESLINGILLNRDRTNPDELLKHFQEKDISYYKELINNNLLGSILLLYTSYQNKTSPYYAGFERFIMLSQNNIRYLLEFCHQSIIEYERINANITKIENFIIPFELQTKAVRNTSKTQIDKIANLGKYGKDLQKIVIRLGKIFLLSQKRNAQSMAEINQFTSKGYEISSRDKDGDELINECKVWGILKEENNNKQTTDKDNARYLYILHPIFAPYFGISHRKQRKIDLTYEEFKNIFIDEEEKYQELYCNYSSKWKLNNSSKNSIYNTNSLLDFI